MSYAWEISDEDIFTVLNAHGIVSSVDDEDVSNGLAYMQDKDHVVMAAVLACTELDDQSKAALHELEKLLAEFFPEIKTTKFPGQE